MIVQKMLGKSILGNDSGLVLAASTETTAPGILLHQCPFVFWKNFTGRRTGEKDREEEREMYPEELFRRTFI